MSDNQKEIFLFQNLQENYMSFEDIFERMVTFMQLQPSGNYRLMVGTDSQVHHNRTLFISGVVIQNIGKGAWACIRKVVEPREMKQLHERISYETTLTERIVSLFTEAHKNRLIDIVLPHIYHGASFTMEGHIDIGSGQRNKTREYVEEMVTRIESMGFEPKICLLYTSPSPRDS